MMMKSARQWRARVVMPTASTAITGACLRTVRLFLLVVTAALAGGQTAAAQDAYPSRPIRLIVPFPPGGPTDVMGRLISQALSDVLGQQVYIDNRPGAGSTLAAKIAG
jgi:tripartite-type tricarboxylate transporter receptor subunit TctC